MRALSFQRISHFRKNTLKGTKDIIRRTRTAVNNGNYKTLQLLDLLKDIDVVLEISGDELKNIISKHMKAVNIGFDMLETYMDYYPDKVYKKYVQGRNLKLNICIIVRRSFNPFYHYS